MKQELINEKWFIISWKLKNNQSINFPVQESSVDQLIEILYNEAKFPRLLEA
jgi:hypothetical protein